MPTLRTLGALAFAAFSVRATLACTAIGVGKDASSSGYPMIVHTEDMGAVPHDIRLVRVPHKTWAPGSVRPVYKWQEPYPRVVSSAMGPEYAPRGHAQKETTPMTHIPQVSETFAYWDTDYGVQNEVGLSIGESTCTARTVGWPVGQPGGFNHVGIEDLSKIAMERCETARCAVETMGKVAVELGFYSADSGPVDTPSYSDTGEALMVGDATPGEIWIFNVLTGKNNASAIWAAQRVPADHIAVIGNSFTIRKMNISDSENYLHSPGVQDLAKENGWWNPAEEVSPDIFDFFGSYGYTATDWKMKNINAYYSGRRMWRVWNLLSPAEGAQLDPNKGHLPKTVDPYPASLPATKGSVTLGMVMHTMRDHYEGTPYDLTKGMAAGPYGNPNRGGGQLVRGQWERAISMYRGAWSFVLVAKPARRGVTWFGWDAPHGTAYLPFFAAAVEDAPESYRSHDAHMSKFTTKAAWWAFNLVNQYQDLNFQAINADVRAKATEVEDEALQWMDVWEAEAHKISNDHEALKFLTTASNKFAEEKVAEWWDLAWSLIGKYRGFLVTYNETCSVPGGQVYPEWWLSSPEVGFTSWTPHGPYTGVPAHPTSSALSSVSPAEVKDLPSCLLCMLATAFAGVIGSLSYRAGVQKGSASLSVDSAHYCRL